MGVVDDLRQLSAAEDFFTYLDVPFDPARLSVVRLHILRRMAEYLRDADDVDGGEDALRIHYRDQLTRAYADFVSSGPLDQRVFKVLKDAVKPKTAAPRVLVPLSALTETVKEEA